METIDGRPHPHPHRHYFKQEVSREKNKLNKGLAINLYVSSHMNRDTKASRGNFL